MELPVVVLGLDTDPARDRWAAEVRRAVYAAATQARSLLLLVVVGDPEVVRGLGLDDLAEQLERMTYLADVTAEGGGSRVVSSPQALLCAGEVMLECVAGHLGPGLVFLLGALLEESFEGLRYPDSDARALALLAGEGRTTGTSELADGAGNAQLLLWQSLLELIGQALDVVLREGMAGARPVVRFAHVVLVPQYCRYRGRAGIA